MEIKTHCDSCGTLVVGVAETLHKVGDKFLCRVCADKTRDPNTLRYAGFWPRFASLLLDFLVILPLGILVIWMSHRYRLFPVYWLGPNTFIFLFFHVYLVRRFGGTPGKLLMGIRIRRQDGSAVGYREAFLRYTPDALLYLLASIALAMPLLQMSDADHQTFVASKQLHVRLKEMAPAWYRPISILQTIWYWSELLVLLTNWKRRALHDFLAGTVVVHARNK